MTRSLYGRVGVGLLWLLALTTMRAEPVTHVRVAAEGPGKVFEGVGETSGGGAIARLLINYPEPQRSEILDYLFKPNFGASLQTLKVEIGGDGNSTEGAEASHMHTATDENYNRGYEWWIMEEARRRNPRIKLIALAWCFPAWVKEANSPATAEYLAKFLDGARRVHGLEIDYIGLWNETEMPLAFFPLLRKTLDAHGLKTQIIADDSVDNWHVADTVTANESLRRDVAVLATHYPASVTTPAGRSFAEQPGKHLWSSEDGPWTDQWASGGEWSRPFAETLNRNYIEGRLTATNLWCLISAYYDILEIPNAGLLRAQSPWSGNYEVMSPVWVVAHTTQFAQPGWRYRDAASGLLAPGGSYVTLTDGDRFSTILETISAGAPQTLDLELDRRYTHASIAVWRTTRSSSFERIRDLPAQGSHVRLLLEPGAVYSITNTQGQHKGETQPPPARPFPLPYRDGFEREAIGNTTPAFFIEQNGSYETAQCAGGRAGKCLAQTVTDVPIMWTSGKTSIDMGTAALIGDKHWADYRVAADFYLDGPGYARVLGRVGRATEDGQLLGYALYLLAEGRWELRTSVHGDTILTGTLPAPRKTWHRAALEFRGSEIAVEIDGRRAGSVADRTYRAGMAGIGNGWNTGQYDNFEITALDGTAVTAAEEAPPMHVPPRVNLYVPTPFAGGVRLTWGSKLPGATGYRVLSGPAPDAMTTVHDAGAQTELRLERLSADHATSFAVVPYNAAGEGPISNVRSATPAPAAAP